MIFFLLQKCLVFCRLPSCRRKALCTHRTRATRRAPVLTPPLGAMPPKEPYTMTLSGDAGAKAFLPHSEIENPHYKFFPFALRKKRNANEMPHDERAT